MAQGEAFEPVKCRKRWGFFGLIIFTYLLVAVLMMAAPIAPWEKNEPTFIKVFWVSFGVFMLLMMSVIVQAMRGTTLYICKDGLGVQFGKDPLKLIHWTNVEAFSATTLCFRLKAYGPWLAQFSEPELRRYWSRGAIIHTLFGWGYFDRKLSDNTDVKAEIATMPPQSLQRKIAQHMLFNPRKQGGFDLGFFSLFCVRQDMDKIEASYVEWMARHPISHN